MKSLWNEDYNFKKRNSLPGDIEADVVIIGAGITGLLIGYMLKQEGKDPIIIEADRIAGGNTKNTTAKITSQHGLIYDTLIKEFGEGGAKEYAKANELAIKKFKEIIEKEKIDCDFEEKEAYIYSRDKEDEIKNEFEAAIRLGIDAELVNEVKLPFDIKLGLKFNHQAQFNPIKFLNKIAKDLTIYENTRALDLKDKTIITNRGEIKANKIVVATHFPIFNTPGYYFMRMYQDRSYVIALENAEDVDGMYIDIDKKDGNSFRNYKNLLLLGGISQRTGENEEGGCYEVLRKRAKELYPNAKEKYHWSAQDCISLDNIPYIGEYSLKTDNLYVATGFKKWGMTTSMVAAMIISDKILGRKNDFSNIFSPDRMDMSESIDSLLKNTKETVKNFIAQIVDIPDSEVEHIKNGHGGLVEYNGEKLGVYKDENGEKYIVKTKCTHLGCQLHWNADELTWDCPCHGSRFDYKGYIIDSPTTKELKNK
ncbi:iron-sulfur cluster-binding protein%2C rieske family [Clostridium baratii]|uniref:FAD-dependent oxidoreductase n=1 Tax=Clostridium baratii TaxID=1561 RepID=UPI0006C706C2|nr:FAD-dependent oxidoreductase [Clostridium baratii]CUP74901.1 iron-sulfur cluster-binding protein%2C rieske family [Clostridium baratii]